MVNSLQIMIIILVDVFTLLFVRIRHSEDKRQQCNLSVILMAAQGLIPSGVCDVSPWLDEFQLFYTLTVEITAVKSLRYCGRLDC